MNKRIALVTFAGLGLMLLLVTIQVGLGELRNQEALSAQVDATSKQYNQGKVALTKEPNSIQTPNPQNPETKNPVTTSLDTLLPSDENSNKLSLSEEEFNKLLTTPDNSDNTNLTSEETLSVKLFDGYFVFNISNLDNQSLDVTITTNQNSTDFIVSGFKLKGFDDQPDQITDIMANVFLEMIKNALRNKTIDEFKLISISQNKLEIVY